MNGVHDMGGMHGFGPVHRDDAPYHAPWEIRLRAIVAAMMRQRVFNVDELRRAIESIPPARYLGSGYFERWLEALEILLFEKGTLVRADIDRAIEHLAQTPESMQRVAPSGTAAPADAITAAVQHPAGHRSRPRRRGSIPTIG